MIFADNSCNPVKNCTFKFGKPKRLKQEVYIKNYL